MVPLREMVGRTAAVMVVPYPPGIPILMPGERVGHQDTAIVEYLMALEQFDCRFPGFSHHMLGIALEHGGGPTCGYRVNCLIERDERQQVTRSLTRAARAAHVSSKSK